MSRKRGGLRVIIFVWTTDSAHRLLAPMLLPRQTPLLPLEVPQPPVPALLKHQQYPGNRNIRYGLSETAAPSSRPVHWQRQHQTDRESACRSRSSPLPAARTPLSTPPPETKRQTT